MQKTEIEDSSSGLTVLKNVFLNRSDVLLRII